MEDLQNWYVESNSSESPIDAQIAKIRYLIKNFTESTNHIDDIFRKSTVPITFVNQDGSCFLNFGVTALMQTPQLEVYMRSIDEKKNKEFLTALNNLLALKSKDEKVLSLVEFRRALGENLEYSMGGNPGHAINFIFKMIPSLYEDTLFLEYNPFDVVGGYLRGEVETGLNKKHLKNISVKDFVKKASASVYHNQSFIVVTLPIFTKITDYPFELRLANPENPKKYVVYDLKITSHSTESHGISRVLIDKSWFEVNNHISFPVFFHSRPLKKVLFEPGTIGLIYHKRT